MRKGVIFVAVFVVVVFVLGSMLSLQASTLAGITMPETVQVGSTPLVLNGMGLRTKFMVKVYVAGNFRTAGAIQADYIAAWDGSAWSAVAGGVNGRIAAENGPTVFTAVWVDVPAMVRIGERSPAR